MGHRLTFADRKKIESMYNANKKPPEIASEIGIAVGTIYRELIRGDTGEMDHNGRIGYSAMRAQDTMIARQKMKRSISYAKHP